VSVSNMAAGFEHPFTCILAGPTKCGKTSFLELILRAPELYIVPAPTRVVWCYGSENAVQMKALSESSAIKIEFISGIPDLGMFSSEDVNLLILDDLMTKAGKSDTVVDIFTKGCHHNNISIFLLMQHYFHQAPKMRDIHTNTHYLVLFNNPREKLFINYLARQCYPDNPNFLVDAYKKACSRPYGYLILDFTQVAPERIRVCSGILPPFPFITLYVPK
jgi:hypothetical protein